MEMEAHGDVKEAIKIRTTVAEAKAKIRRLGYGSLTLLFTGVGIVSYVACIALGLFWWHSTLLLLEDLMPGFAMTPAGFTIGLIWTIGYAIFLAIVVGFIYNSFVGRYAPIEVSH